MFLFVSLSFKQTSKQETKIKQKSRSTKRPSKNTEMKIKQQAKDHRTKNCPQSKMKQNVTKTPWVWFVLAVYPQSIQACPRLRLTPRETVRGNSFYFLSLHFSQSHSCTVASGFLGRHGTLWPFPTLIAGTLSGSNPCKFCAVVHMCTSRVVSCRHHFPGAIHNLWLLQWSHPLFLIDAWALSGRMDRDISCRTERSRDSYSSLRVI